MEAIDRLARLHKFLSLDPENLNLWLDTVRLAVDLQEWQTAKAFVDQVPASLLSNADVNGLVGHTLLAHGFYDDAASYLERAIDIGITQPAAWIDLAYCHLYRNLFAEAFELLNDNRDLKAVLPGAYLMLYARLQYYLDDSEGAIQSLKELHEQFSITDESAGLLALLLFEADREYHDAMKLADLALEKNPHAIEALLARSSLHLDAGAYEQANADIQLAVQHHPKVGRAWATLAQVEFNDLHFENARDAAETAVKTMPDHIGTWHMLGWSHLMLGNYPDALLAFQKSYELDRRFAETHGGLASVYAHMGESKLANNHIKLAERLDSEAFSIVYAKMVLMNQDNQKDKAQELFIKTVNAVSNKLQKTPAELIKKRMHKLMQPDSGKNTLQ